MLDRKTTCAAFAFAALRLSLWPAGAVDVTIERATPYRTIEERALRAPGRGSDRAEP